MTDFNWSADDPIVDDHPDPDLAAELQAEDQQARAAIDLSEAINAARLAWHAETARAVLQDRSPSAGELADAMITAAAPIIARQMAERLREVAEQIAENAWDEGNCCGLDGWIGPGRGEPVDDEAMHARGRDVAKILKDAGVHGA